MKKLLCITVETRAAFVALDFSLFFFVTAKRKSFRVGKIWHQEEKQTNHEDHEADDDEERE
jgi:hypothetical protein